jgi:hypothetical protein
VARKSSHVFAELASFQLIFAHNSTSAHMLNASILASG